jgi:hypothetical protein
MRESIPDVFGLGRNAAMNLGRFQGRLDTRTEPTRGTSGAKKLARVVSEYRFPIIEQVQLEGYNFRELQLKRREAKGYVRVTTKI